MVLWPWCGFRSISWHQILVQSHGCRNKNPNGSASLFDNIRDPDLYAFQWWLEINAWNFFISPDMPMQFKSILTPRIWVSSCSATKKTGFMVLTCVMALSSVLWCKACVMVYQGIHSITWLKDSFLLISQVFKSIIVHLMVTSVWRVYVHCTVQSY